MTISRGYDFRLDWSKVREASLGPGDESVLVTESNRRLFARWMAAGHGEWMVPRDAFDVIELGGLVGALCVHDRDEDLDDYLCRVCGSDVAHDLGVDLTGRLMSSYPASILQAVRTGYDRALVTRRPFVSINLLVRIERSEVYPREDGRVLHEKLILPVTRGGRGIDCFITHVARMPADALAGDTAAGSICPNEIA